MSLDSLKIRSLSNNVNKLIPENLQDVSSQLAQTASQVGLDTEKAERQAEVATERSRITNLATLTAGSTTGDAELIDNRVSANGIRHASSGEAMRSLGLGKVNNGSLKLEKLSFLSWDTTKDYLIDKAYIQGYNINQTTGALITDAAKCITEMNEVNENTNYTLSGFNTAIIYPQRVAFYDSTSGFISSTYNFNTVTVNSLNYKAFTTPANCKFIRIIFLVSQYTSFNNIRMQKDTVIPDNPPTFAKDVIIPRYQVQIEQSRYEEGVISSTLESMVTTKTDEIRSILETASSNVSVVPIITDIHWTTNYKQSPMLLQRLDRYFNFPVILNGGDITPSVDASLTTVQAIVDTITDCMDSFGNLNNKMLQCIGNHETMMNSTQVSTNILQPYLYIRNRKTVLAPSRSAGGNAKALYGYVDDEQAKIRYITLNYMDSFDGYSWSWGLSQKQLEWLGSVALNMPTNEWHVAIIIHNGVYYSDNTKVNWFANADILYDLLSHAYTGTAYTVVDHQEQNSGGTINYPISNMSITFPHAVPIIGVFCGHYHTNDAFNAITGGSNGIIQYTHNSQAINLVHIEWDSRVSEKAQCFDIAIIDKASKTVNLKRIGSGADRSFTY